MDNMRNGAARAVGDLATGQLLASVELAASPVRVFRALTSDEITKWWVRPGVFDTREWTGDVRAGGRWRATGMTRGQPYAQEGEFLEVSPPDRLVHTWDGVGVGSQPSTITYQLEPLYGGTRLTLRQHGFVSRERCEAFAIGWETSLERLAELLAPEFSLEKS